MLTIWNKVGALGSVASIIGLLLYFVPFSIDKANVDGPTSDLYFKSARFRPMETFFVRPEPDKINDFYETAFLYVTVLNVGNEDVFITSMEVVDVNNKGIMSNAYSSSGLGPDVSKNSPIKIPAGKEVEFGFSGGFRFNGLIDFFDLDKLSNEPYFSDMSPRISSRTDLVSEFNDTLIGFFYGQTNIKVILYERNRNKLAEHFFNITAGTDIFDNNGQIQHSYFLGDLIHWLRSPYSRGVLNKSKHAEGVNAAGV